MSKVSVIIVDDHAIVRDGIKSVLMDSDEVDVVGEAADGDEALTMLEKGQPDILLTDITMPEKSGIELAAIVSEKYPDTKVVMFSMHENEEYITKSIENKAAGYLSKNADKDEIVQALRTVAAGGQYYSSSISQAMLSSFVNKTKQTAELDASEIHLTAREKEVLKLVAGGLSSKSVADKLFISTRTVETHRNNIMQKLNVKNTAELVKYSIENKLIDS